MLKNPFSPRLLKKVQMQGGVPGTHPQDGCRREAIYLTPLALSPSKGAAPRERGGTHRMWVSADGPFSAVYETGGCFLPISGIRHKQEEESCDG
jgi:hypothetical protein